MKWNLAPFSSKEKILTTGIGAGRFTDLDMPVQVMLNLKLPENARIRMTEYARLSVLMNDIGTVFSDRAREVEMENGEFLKVWWVTGFWNTNQWNLVSELLNHKILEPEPESENRLENLLWLHETGAQVVINKKRPCPVLSYLKSPGQVGPGLEIVRVLFLRKRFYEAKEILRLILNVEPYNPVALSFMVMIYRSLGQDDSEQYSVSEEFFKLAETDDPAGNKNFLLEYAMLKLARAVRILRVLRKNKGEYKDDGIILTKHDVYNLLDEAEKINERAVAGLRVSYRVLYWRLCIRSLKDILKQDEGVFEDKTKLIVDRNGACKKNAQKLIRTLCNKDRESVSLSRLYANILKTSGHSKAVNPVIDPYFCAVFCWDFGSEPTVHTAQKVIRLLNQALSMACKLKENRVCAYIPLRACMEVMPPDLCIEYIKKTITGIKTRLENLDNPAGSKIIDLTRVYGLTLFTMHV